MGNGKIAPVKTAAEEEDAHESKNDEEESPDERNRGQLAWCSGNTQGYGATYNQPIPHWLQT